MTRIRITKANEDHSVRVQPCSQLADIPIDGNSTRFTTTSSVLNDSAVEFEIENADATGGIRGGGRRGRAGGFCAPAKPGAARKRVRKSRAKPKLIPAPFTPAKEYRTMKPIDYRSDRRAAQEFANATSSRSRTSRPSAARSSPRWSNPARARTSSSSTGRPSPDSRSSRSRSSRAGETVPQDADGGFGYWRNSPMVRLQDHVDRPTGRQRAGAPVDQRLAAARHSSATSWSRIPTTSTSS
jgi:hypothetical protein